MIADSVSVMSAANVGRGGITVYMSYVMEVLLGTDDRGFGVWPGLGSRGERMYRGFCHCSPEALVREPVP
jgi:hypothetical protein